MENESKSVERKNMYVPIFITQAVCIAVILITVLVIKLFFDNTYKEVKKWHDENLLEETTITANFEEEQK